MTILRCAKLNQVNGIPTAQFHERADALWDLNLFDSDGFRLTLKLTAAAITQKHQAEVTRALELAGMPQRPSFLEFQITFGGYVPEEELT